MDEEKTWQERYREKMAENGRKGQKRLQEKYGDRLKEMRSKAGKKGVKITNRIKKMKRRNKVKIK